MPALHKGNSPGIPVPLKTRVPLVQQWECPAEQNLNTANWNIVRYVYTHTHTHREEKKEEKREGGKKGDWVKISQKQFMEIFF